VQGVCVCLHMEKKCEWLFNPYQTRSHRIYIYNTYHNIVSNTEIIPENAWVVCIDKNVGLLM
jgi:hypothetical protein